MYERVNILGVQFSAVNMAQTVGVFDDWIKRRTPQYVCITPAHGVMDCQNNDNLLQIFNSSGLTTPDGMSIVWLLHWYGKKQVDRVYGPDLMLNACQYGMQFGWRHFFYGGKQGVPELLAKRLQQQFPRLQVAGYFSPPFHELSHEEEQMIIARIQAAKPDIVWVGISTPKQEQWMSKYVRRLGVPVLVGVGAAFDFLSGSQRQAPHWIQKSGFEWLFRLLNEPKRLWPRYIRYPKFAVLALSQMLGIRKYSD